MFFPGGRACLQEGAAGILKENAVRHGDGAKAFSELQNSRECHLLLACSRYTRLSIEIAIQVTQHPAHCSLFWNDSSLETFPFYYSTKH